MAKRREANAIAYTRRCTQGRHANGCRSGKACTNGVGLGEPVTLHRCELSMGPLQNSRPPLPCRLHCSHGIRVGKLHRFAIINN